MPYPTPIVEIAFDDGPYVVSPTWTDVTAYCRGFSTSRGVPDDWTYQADGSASVTLSNRDRRFDPFNASGPYYGKLLPRRQIRIRATSGGTTYDVFRGFVAGWPPQWTDAGYDSIVELSCFDALQLLGSNTMPVEWAQPYIETLNPRHYWRCNDPVPFYQSTAQIADYGSAPSALTTNSTTQITGGLADGLPQNAIGSNFFVNGNGFGVQTLTTPNVNSDVTLAFWTRTQTADLNAGQVSVATGGFSVELKQVTRASSADYGKFYGIVYTTIGFTVWKTNTFYEPGNVYHAAFTYDRTIGTGVIYINGIADTGSPTTTFTPYTISTLENCLMAYGDFQQVLVFSSVLTATQIQTIVQFGQGLYAETTSARVSRIIGQTPFPTGLVSTPASPTGTVLALTNNAPTASFELSKVAASEYAPLFVNKAGTLTLYKQNQIRSQTKSIVSQATYGAGGLSIGTDIQLQYDGDSMRNVASVDIQAAGTVQTARSTSVTTYAQAEEYIETQVSTVPQAQQIGNIVTGWGGQVYPKASPVDVVLDPSASWASTLGLELFERITLAVAPKTGSTITVPMLVSRISHSVTPERWSTSLEGSARWAAVFIVGTSTLGGTDLLG